MDKFPDAKQILELKDSFPFGENEFVISTIMLDEPKVIHGRKYWFETYLIEVDKEGKMILGKLNNQYLTAYEAIQGHKLASINFNELVVRAKIVFSPQQESIPEVPKTITEPVERQKTKKALDKT
jgi:hypothetical protein